MPTSAQIRLKLPVLLIELHTENKPDMMSIGRLLIERKSVEERERYCRSWYF